MILPRRAYTSKKENGQALLLVLLSMSAVVTIALSVISRSISDISITTQDEESLRAFSAAEAGVERALVSQVPVGGSLQAPISEVGLAQEARFSAGVVGFPNGTGQYVYPLELSNGDAATLWFMDHDALNRLTCASGSCYTGSSLIVCWGRPGTAANATTAPAISGSVVYDSGAGVLDMIRFTADSYQGSRNPANSFVAAGGCPTPGGRIAGKDFAFGTNVVFSSIPFYNSPGVMKMLRIRMLYNTNLTQPVGFYAMTVFPPQGKLVNSTGTSGSSTRKVDVYSLYPDLPSSLDFALSIGGDMVK